MKSIIQGHRAIALDTCFWIYHFENHPDYQKLTTQILADVSAGRVHAYVSELTLLELLVRPLQLERQDIADEYEMLLTHFPNLDLVPISRDILLQAASIRAKYGLRAPDTIIVASGIMRGATLAITNDEKWKRVEEIKVVCLSDFLSV